MGKNYLSDLEGPYQTQAPDDWSWLDYIKAAGSDTGNALSNLAGGIVGGMSPFAPTATQYGKPSLQVPPMIYDAWEAINAPGKILNEGMTPEDRDRTATNAAGFMMGGGLVAPKPANALAANGGRVVEGAKPIRAYRGSKTPEDVASAKDTYWATSNPETASDFAMMNEWPKQTHPNVSPVDVNFKNPLTINSNTPYDWLNVPYDGASRPWTNSVADKARELGHDGVIFKNIMEGTGDVPATTYAALQRGTVTSPLTGETLFSSGSKPGAAAGNALVESQQPKGFTAYHGSPHDFDKFSLDKIGTGEGAQAYGHGLYFADAEDVAHSYKTNLANAKRDTAADDATLKAAGLTDYQIEQARPFIADTADIQSGFKSFLNWTGVSETPELKAAFADVINRRPTGKMYQVRINADPESFLDWDKPLSQQPSAARSVIESDPIFSTEMYSSAPDNTMRNLLRDHGTTAKLREAGIPGIRYLDGNSRGAGQGSSNYVVFDESLIDILKKYGLTGGAIGAGSALNWDDPTTY